MPESPTPNFPSTLPSWNLPGSPTPTPSLSPTQQRSLVRLDQVKRWGQGERVLVEEYLQRLPALAHDPEAILDLVYQEVVLREEKGDTPQLEEYLQRFPQYAEDLRLQFSVHGAFQAGVPLEEICAVTVDARPTVPSASKVPQVAGYEILDVLGRGGMGVVYKARQVKLKRLVALKMILDGEQADAAQLARFRSEAEAVARLQHPHIVQIYEVGETEGRPFFSLEFCTGGSLEKQLGGKPQPPRQAAELIELLARAMDAAHQAGIIHRDLKPANVLLARGDKRPRLSTGGEPTSEAAGGYEPKITDFGLAKKLDEPGLTQEGDVMGTPSYMAPEQAAGKTDLIGPATDIYALGAILYELLTGRPPFQADSILAILQRVLLEDPIPVHRLQPKCPADLDTICLKCLEKPPARRYASAGELADDLRRFLNNEPIQARPASLVERGFKWARRRPIHALLGGVSVIALVGTITALLVVQHLRVRQARAELEATTAKAEAAQARAEQAEAEANAADAQKETATKVANARIAVGGQLADIRTALARSEEKRLAHLEDEARALLQKARGQAADALQRIQEEPALADFHDQAVQLAGEIDRREHVRQNYQQLFVHRDEALSHLTRPLITNLDLPRSLQQARKEAEAALQLFGVTLDPGQVLTLDDLYTPEQKADIVRGCFEALLLEAEALTHPVPGQQDEERRRLAQEALPILERADHLLPGTGIVHRRRGRCLEILGDGTAARQEYDQARVGKRATPLDAFLLGYDRFMEGQADAVPYFDRAIREQRGFFWAHFFRALAYQRTPNLVRPAGGVSPSSPAEILAGQQSKKLTEARASLTVCAELRSDFVWVYLLRGFLSGELRDFETAREDFDRAAELLAEKPDTQAEYVLAMNRGVLALQQRKVDDAIAELSRAGKLQPELPQPYLNLARAYEEKGALPEALAALATALTLAQREPAPHAGHDQALVYRARVRVQLRRQDLDAALRDVEEAIEREPADSNPLDQAEEHLDRALILYRNRQYREAVQECEQTLQAHGELVVFYRLQGLALARLKRPTEALAAFDRYLEKGPPRADVFQARALAHIELHDYAAAVDDYGRALALEPKDAALHADRGWTYLANDAPQLALPDFKEAVRLAPDRGDAYTGLGLARVKLAPSWRAVAEGVADADRAVRDCGPPTPDLLVHAARVYAQAVGKLDADTTASSLRALDTRSLYQDRALALLSRALTEGHTAERTSLWERIQKDSTFAPLHRSPRFKELAPQP